MRWRLFYHSLVSDWNHGNAHFLRGVVSELTARGHDVCVYEPEDGWSRSNLIAERGADALDEFRATFPHLTSATYRAATFDVDEALDGADVVLVHEWTDPSIVERIAEHRTRGANYGLLFHDTHHRAVSGPDALTVIPLESFDGVLAFGASLAQQYERLGWGRRVWVWHEAADTRVFYPRESSCPHHDIVWIGNWGDGERASELREFLLEPVRRLKARARAHGVRYPDHALEQLAAAGVDYGGWIPNARVPQVFSQSRATVHIPRGPYVASLSGIPTIRPFEALACGIPLVCAPWDDTEGLFKPDDYLRAADASEMTSALRRILHDPDLAASLRTHGLDTIRARHTCAHRVDELLSIVDSLGVAGRMPLAQEA